MDEVKNTTDHLRGGAERVEDGGSGLGDRSCGITQENKDDRIKASKKPVQSMGFKRNPKK